VGYFFAQNFIFGRSPGGRELIFFFLFSIVLAQEQTHLVLHRALLPLEKKERKKEQQVKKKGGLGREQARAEQQEKVQGARAREEKEKEKR
jgi:hypothetical protein